MSIFLGGGSRVLLPSTTLIVFLDLLNATLAQRSNNTILVNLELRCGDRGGWQIGRVGHNTRTRSLLQYMITFLCMILHHVTLTSNSDTIHEYAA